MASDQASTPRVPRHTEYMNPIISVLRDAGGPLKTLELNTRVAKLMALPDDVMAVIHNPEQGDRPEAFYRMAWSRTYLKKMGIIDNPSRSMWELTEKGRKTKEIDPKEIARQVREGVDADVLSAEVPEHIADELIELYRAIEMEGEIPIGDALAASYLRFREKFGPDVLKNLEGEQLLEAIHGRGKDSLTYWLEFKKDDEFPGVFGSIAGGSALKYGIYLSRDTGHWMTGHSKKQQRIALSEAIATVHEQRDELLAGAAVLAEYYDDPASADFEAIQKRMDEAAPNVAYRAWGHKYFSLLYPNLLDHFHVIGYQKHNLFRLHKLPTDGMYENARFFSGIARQIGVSAGSLSIILNRRDGNPCTYWRVETSPGESGPSEWPRMRDGGFAAVGWNEVGNLSEIDRSSKGKDKVRALLAKHYPDKKAVVTHNATQLYYFAARVEPGDVVVAMKGPKVLGVGDVEGDYFFVEDEGQLGHRRSVNWRSVEEWQLPTKEALGTSFARLSRYPMNLVEIERRRSSIGADESEGTTDEGSIFPPPPKRLSGIINRVQLALQRKRQVILYGPPGTGKTYWAEQAIAELAARSWFGRPDDQLTDSERQQLRDQGAIEHCCFHPAYGYEDFLVGYRPVLHDGSVGFQPRKGIFAKLCERAINDPKHKYYLLVDEINRGDIPRIFGELITVLEKDKRGNPMTLPLTGEELVVPDNVHLVGTMNTADRSIALLDAALRRRFAFIELMPDSTTLRGASVGGLPLGPWLDELNKRVVQHAGRGSRNLQIGHSYLLAESKGIEDKARFAEVLRDDIIPLLQEYCYEDFKALEQILGSAIVLSEQQTIQESLFRPENRAALIEALLLEFQDITATPEAVDADAEGETAEEEDLLDGLDEELGDDHDQEEPEA